MKFMFIKKLNVNFISLVDNPSNGKGLIYKSRDSFVKEFEISKSDDEKKIIYGIVYSPDELDSQGMFTNSKVIEEAAFNFLKNGKSLNVDNQHNLIPDVGFVCESWIVKEKDSVFNDQPIGSWAVGIKIINDEIWNAVKENRIRGLSLYGNAILEERNEEENLPFIIKKIKNILEPFGKKFNLADKGEKLEGLISELETELEIQKEISKKVGEIIEQQSLKMEEVKKLESRISKIENLFSSSSQPQVITKQQKQKIWF